MNSSTYTEAFKQNALLKVYERKGRTIATVAKDLNLNISTLKGWMQHTKRQHPISSIPVAKRPDDWTLEARLLALQQSHGLSEEALSVWCREQGIFAHHLTQWRKDFCAVSPKKTSDSAEEIRTLKQANKTLERELTRKEKALAEAAALLILQKKFHALWEDEDK